MTSKFKELATGVKQDMANFDQQATELLARRENIRRRGETVFARHRDNLTELEGGLDAMEEALHDLEGSNSKNGEGSGDTSDSSFSKG